MTSDVSIVIPTYGRDGVLLATVAQLLSQDDVGEILVVDQTPAHEPATGRQLRDWDAARVIRWLQLPQPSIPHAMNVGLREARGDVVLFLDDDIEPAAGLVATHLAAHEQHPEAWAVVGQVLQPGEQPASRNGWLQHRGFRADLDFPFWSNERAWVSNVMAGNLSVKRERALEVCGFDENFTGVAYRFETEFSRRMIAAGGKILFEPAASLRHLRAARGGTRSTGSHLTSASPAHGMGDYYFALRSGLSQETLAYMLRRPLREVSTRFHLRHPWYVPVKLVGEARAFAAAIGAMWSGPRLLNADARFEAASEHKLRESQVAEL